jgi:hypothetical protein
VVLPIYKKGHKLKSGAANFEKKNYMDCLKKKTAA